MKSKSEIKRIAAVNPKQLEEECLQLRHKLQIAKEALVDLLSWCANGTNYGKGWSEYQIDDDAIAKARAALKGLVVEQDPLEAERYIEMVNAELDRIAKGEE